MVSERLKEVRLIKKMTLEEVAKRIGVTKQAVSKYETGKTIPVTNILEKILALYGIQPDFLTSKRDLPPERTIVFYRKEKRTAQKEMEAAGVYLKWLYEIITEVDKICSVKHLELPRFPAGCSIKERAELLRCAWNLGERPIDDIVAILEGHGFFLFTSHMQDKKIDGYSQMIGTVPVIVLNRAKGTKERRRFSIAHELGHLILHGGMERVTDQMEDEADEFAGCFLMPERAIKAELLRKDADYFISLAAKWGVSPQALVERCSSLQLLGRDEAECRAKRNSLYQNLNRKKVRLDDGSDDDRICSLEKKLYLIESNAEAAQGFLRELHLPLSEVRRLCEMPEGFAQYEQSYNNTIDEIDGVQLRFNF